MKLRHSTYVEVRLGNIRKNIEHIRSNLAPKSTPIVMVKGQAYGNGLERVSEYLHDKCDITCFGVASLGEAQQLLTAVPQIDTAGRNIFVFSDNEFLNPEFNSYYTEQNAKAADGEGAKLWPILTCAEQINYFVGERFDKFKDTPLCVKVGTGMNRMGVNLDELHDLIPTLKLNGGVDLLLQHFRASGLVGHPVTDEQYHNFEKAKTILRDADVEVRATSCANSGAIERGIGVEETYVRPGCIVYGYSAIENETEAAQKHFRPSHFLYSKIIKAYTVKAGQRVGYGVGDNMVEEDSFVALIPLGYADGFSRYYKGLEVEISPALPHGQDESVASRANQIVGKVFGNVNMDAAAILIRPSVCGKSLDELKDLVKAESEVLVWGPELHKTADSVGTVLDELMCGLTTRVPRVYVE
ncbi:Alanine racemase, N-terminal domain/Alanine racemase, C-terminal domain containing protein, putative [Angomonas deanei]|uniref:Alanine racemase, N-terminal domain/Alanine racemase, C-terminal domain containing protein, putative n=1 Tax=Angomonas deanei TaxID=59799 RepID=A0A7G2C941_9TRYP|nr:Alanine racemase, N-terminal domain/Alanine racemase, C-terminal domain containing protein, putative [Angomonas deanei]